LAAIIRACVDQVQAYSINPTLFQPTLPRNLSMTERGRSCAEHPNREGTPLRAIQLRQNNALPLAA
jgi:hypothetical protein